MRSGIPLAVVASGAADFAAEAMASAAGAIDSSVGKATQTPRPRRKVRRLMEGSLLTVLFLQIRRLPLGGADILRAWWGRHSCLSRVREWRTFLSSRTHAFLLPHHYRSARVAR